MRLQPIEDNRLRAFCLIVEMGSFRKAGDAILKTQSALSHLIKKLEKAMGVKLLKRSGRKVIPTPAGWLFYNQARKILEAYTTLGNGINGFVREIHGPLTLGVSTSAKYVLPRVIYEFSKRYPEVKIEVTVSNAETIMHEIQHGNADFGILEEHIAYNGIVSEAIVHDEIVLIASDENPLAKNEFVTHGDFLSQPFIMPPTGSGMQELIRDYFRASKMDPKSMNISFTVGDPELIVEMVQSGLGIAFISKWSVLKPLKEGTIRIVKLPGKRISRKFYLVSLKKEPSATAGKTFRKFIKDYPFLT